MDSIDQGNKIIAEFMGMPIEPQNAEYHTSWDWLMPVVEKIETMPDMWSKIIGENKLFQCSIEHFDWSEAILVQSETSKIIATWEAIVQFITWYNSQTPKQNG